MHYELLKLSNTFVEDDVSEKSTQYADKTSIEITIATTDNHEVIVNEDCYADEHEHDTKIIDKFFHICLFFLKTK